MAEPRTIDYYGGPFQDAEEVQNPQTQISAAQINRFLEDEAQLTRTFMRAVVWFDAVNDAAPFVLPSNQVFIRTAWGDGVSYKPTVTKTAVGRYTVEFAASYIDGLGESENVGFVAGHVTGHTNDATDTPDGTRLLTRSANIATLVAKDAGAPADQAASGEQITVTVWLV